MPVAGIGDDEWPAWDVATLRVDLCLQMDLEFLLWFCMEARDRLPWSQRYWALVRWSLWYWRRRRRAAALDPRQHRPTCAADGAHEVPQDDAGVATERRVLAALYEASRRELP
jgi:hypothetical protein